MNVTIASFGYKHSAPPKGAKTFDCRDVPNPHRHPDLRSPTGPA
jgi:RNase adaptor protein for sRNA GlmZ degradation